MQGLRILAAALSMAVLSVATGEQTDVDRQVRLLIDNGQFTKALGILEGQRKLAGRDPDILYLRGYVLYRLHKLEAAKSDLNLALKMAPSRLRSSYILGRIAQQQGRSMEAIRWLEPCALAKPPVEDSPARIGQLYWNIGQSVQARTWTEKAVELTPWDGGLHYRLGRIYQQLGEGDGAKREFAESVRTKTADSEGVLKLMECSRALSSRDTATALRIRGEFLTNPGLDPDLLVALGTSFATSDAPDQAIDLYRLAAQRDPTSFQANFNLGLALLNMNRADEAIKPLETSLQLAPQSKQANAALALVYVSQSKFREAVGPLESAKLADPDDRKIEGLLSVAYFRSGAAAKAIPILRQLIEAKNDDPKLYFLLVDCLNASEKQQEALVVAGKTVERFPELAKSWLSKGQQLARLGQYHDAGPIFAKAAELAPLQVEPLLGLGEAQQKDGDYQAAFETYQRAIAQDNDVTAVLGAAKSLVFLGRVAEARGLLEHSVLDNITNSQLHVELSRVYARLGEKSLAQEQTRIVEQLRAQEGQGERDPSSHRDTSTRRDTSNPR